MAFVFDRSLNVEMNRWEGWKRGIGISVSYRIAWAPYDSSERESTQRQRDWGVRRRVGNRLFFRFQSLPCPVSPRPHASRCSTLQRQRCDETGVHAHCNWGIEPPRTSLHSRQHATTSKPYYARVWVSEWVWGRGVIVQRYMFPIFETSAAV